MSAREELGRHVQEIRTLSGILGLLSWDQQVHMPPGGAQARGAQLALLSEAVHARVSDGRMEGWLTELAGSQDPILAGGVRNLRRRYDRACRIPMRLVGERARAEAEGFEAWMKAREERDFSVFAPKLQQLVDLSIESAQHIDDSRPVYDVLLDDYLSLIHI